MDNKRKLSYEDVSAAMDPLYELNLPKDKFGPAFEAILQAAGWSEADFWQEENDRVERV